MRLPVNTVIHTKVNVPEEENVKIVFRAHRRGLVGRLTTNQHLNEYISAAETRNF